MSEKKWEVGDLVSPTNSHGWTNPGHIIIICDDEWLNAQPPSIRRESEVCRGLVGVEYGTYPNYDSFWYSPEELEEEEEGE